ncbi:MAG TPA: UPF0175 family protein [Pirellulales bacterium]|nr:UPF0175 family protein [Pirellulales bacterium]
MPLNVTFDFPTDVEEKLRRDGTNFDADVKEAFLTELFRRGKISHYDLSRTLRLDRFETDAWLKRHSIFEGSPSMEDLETDRQTLTRLVG